MCTSIRHKNGGEQSTHSAAKKRVGSDCALKQDTNVSAQASARSRSEYKCQVPAYTLVEPDCDAVVDRHLNVQPLVDVCERKVGDVPVHKYSQNSVNENAELTSLTSFAITFNFRRPAEIILSPLNGCPKSYRFPIP
jgi:hypothetical protein